eukprot:1045382-Pleurochrysis_carterae.AAC.2
MMPTLPGEETSQYRLRMTPKNTDCHTMTNLSYFIAIHAAFKYRIHPVVSGCVLTVLSISAPIPSALSLSLPR